MKKGMIFFDIDGTLLDHKGAEIEGIRKFYLKNNFDGLCEFEEFRAVWIKYSDKNFERFLKKEISFEEQRAMRIIDIYNEFGKDISYESAFSKFTDYLLAYEDSWKAYDDVIECLERLKEYKLGIISNGDYKQQVQKLEKIGVKEYFSDIIAASDVGCAKPDTKIFEIACSRNNKDITNTYYVGDNLKSDILPCKEIGMKAILVNRDKASEAPQGVNRVYSLNDIKSFIENN